MVVVWVTVALVAGVWLGATIYRQGIKVGLATAQKHAYMQGVQAAVRYMGLPP